MNSPVDAIQAALGGRRTTLCTYEHPAALHEIRAWVRTMRDTGRLIGEPVVMEDFHLTTSYKLERADGGDEVLFAIGLEDGQTASELRAIIAALTTTLTVISGLPRPWFKALFFGRIPTDDRLNVLTAHWMGVVHRPSPCGHPVCRATHACIAPDIGGS